jgi:hypothetical protein
MSSLVKAWGTGAYRLTAALEPAAETMGMDSRDPTPWLAAATA